MSTGISQDTGPEVYECDFEPADLHKPLPSPDLDFDDIEVAPKVKAKPFDPLDEIGVPRDRWGRPQVLPDPAWNLPPAAWPDGKTTKYQMADGRRPFARVSTACGWNDVAHGLSIWRQRLSLLALARRPDVQALLAGMTYKDGKAIDALVDELMMRGTDDGIDKEGEMTAANRGTAWHTFTTPGAPPIHPVYGPTLAQYDVATRALRDALDRNGLELIEHERFGVDYARQIAGTVDHLAIVTRETALSRAAGLGIGDVVCLDKKTGKMQWITHVTQLAMYARCRPHDWRTGVTAAAWHPQHNPDVGIIAAASIETGEVKLYPVKTPAYLADSAVDRYRNSLAEHVNSLLISKGF